MRFVRWSDRQVPTRSRRIRLGLHSAVGLAGFAVATAGLPGSVAAAAGEPDLRGEIVAGALAALRENAGRLGFDTDHQGAQGLGSRYEVAVTDVMVDPDGSTHVRMDRSYAGLPVRGGDFVVHRSAGGRWIGASATLARSLAALDVVPALSDAVAIGLVGVGTGLRMARTVGAPVLSIDALHGAPALAWEVLTSGTQRDGSPSRLETVVDAVTGAVRAREEKIDTLRIADPDPGGDTGPLAGAMASPDSSGKQADPAGRQSESSGEAPASSVRQPAAKPRAEAAGGEPTTTEGRSLYDGKVPLSTSVLSGVYALKDLTRGGSYTADAEDVSDDCLPVALPVCSSSAPSRLFTSKTNLWGDGTTGNRATVAVDAQYGSNETWDYYKSTFHRAGINNDGLGVYSRVHYGQKYANAFWNDDCFCMTYGDGDGKDLGPLVSLNITGHEITHGLTARTAKLGNSGESGALNEANSDIFGTMIEFQANNPASPGSYLIGHTSFVHPADEHGRPNAIRYMAQPSIDKASPDCWNSQVKFIDVHLGAGIGDHFFYLLSEGSGRKTINGFTYDSPTCNGKKVSGIGRDTAARIWYRAMTRYFTSGTDYADTRAAVVHASADLYGPNSREVTAVSEAWDAVNVHVDDSSNDIAGGVL